MKNIPKHTKCTGCGGCCGPVPIIIKEQRKIQNYVDKVKPPYDELAGFMECKFRVNGKCSIYPVRPIMCKLFGVSKGLECVNGNSENIDGTVFLSKSDRSCGIVNEVIITKY